MKNKSFSIMVIIQLILIAMKLCAVITWSWGAVLIPLWIGIGLFIAGFILGLLFD